MLGNMNIQSLLPLVLLLVLFYFLFIRPSMKQNKQTRNFIETMEVGDEVMTAGGFYGIVYAIDDENVVLEMLPDYNKLMIRKSSIVKFITAEAAQAEAQPAGGQKKGLFGKMSAGKDATAKEEPETVEAEATENAAETTEEEA